jgi:hypothetical protein
VGRSIRVGPILSCLILLCRGLILTWFSLLEGGGWGFEQCGKLVNAEFERVYYKSKSCFGGDGGGDGGGVGHAHPFDLGLTFTLTHSKPSTHPSRKNPVLSKLFTLSVPVGAVLQ